MNRKKTFRFRAVERSGKAVAGETEADSAAAVADWLKSRDLLTLQVAEVKSPRFAGLLQPMDRLSLARRLLLTRELAVLLGAGLKLDQALALLQKAAVRPAEAGLLARVLAKVQGGAPFSEALASEGRSFPQDHLAVVRAGEAGGNLAPALDRLAESLERAHRIKTRIQGQLIYPAILTVAAIGSVVILLTVIVPAFAPLFAEAGRELPPITRAMISLAAFLRTGGPLILAGLLGAALSARQLRPRHPLRRRLDRLVLAVPVWGPLRSGLDAARFCRTLGTLLANGVPMLRALAFGRAAIFNTALADSIDQITEGVRQGRPLHQHMRSGRRWPPAMAELCQVGEETGRLPEMMLKLADMFDEDCGQRLERLVSLLTPVITLFLGLLVAGVLAGLLSTILSVNDLVQ